ncbi:SOS response-associated peptidase family protein [Pseudomonas kuykendallii]|uniref:SOS response-associated peptidase family protein n=1 Tax=Pseudomonas kuykendallii TaxID=1007099 RepID=UPI0028D79F27|nr:SOS response-associated peptidase family protein [Pseudomonas kuykendallii]
MCGRFTQYRTAIEYLEALRYEKDIMGGFDPEPIGRYNVAPRSRVLMLFENDEGARFAKIPWGYEPFWAKGKRPPAINARVETAATSRFFRDVWRNGRCLVMADGWYEWVKDANDPKKKQPFYIRLKSQEPMWFAALGQFNRESQLEEREGDGFVIITAESDQGMVDIHDRRPVVLSPELAREWIEPDLGAERAEEIVRTLGTPVEDFEWFEVDRAVGNVRNEGPGLIRPLSPHVGESDAVDDFDFTA